MKRMSNLSKIAFSLAAFGLLGLSSSAWTAPPAGKKIADGPNRKPASKAAASPSQRPTDRASRPIASAKTARKPQGKTGAQVPVTKVARAKTIASIDPQAKAASPPIPIVTAVAPADAAREIDRLLAAELGPKSPLNSSAVVDDYGFLRRVSLDAAGRLPTPQEITAFALDPAPDKRAQTVDRLLSETAYGENWGRYWRDVIMYRRSDERGQIVAASLQSYLSEQFNQNLPWDQIARAFITATGDVQENGATGIIMAQMGETADVTAEMSRIFLGVQIQCAQCHDHPSDRWKREQFHELAAFFPRIAIRPKREPMRSFEVASVDRDPRVKAANNRPRGRAEHFMPDLQDPSARGTAMDPVFFVTGQKLAHGQADADRRQTIADWMTSRNDPWFAKAYVNRLWTELVGHGFYDSVDDLGPDRECQAPRTLDYLSAQFVAQKHDTKWLFRAITATRSYQRALDARSATAAAPPPEASSPRLRGDQLYSALAGSLEMPDAAPRAQTGGPRALQRSPRYQFNAVFGFDPSLPRDEVAGSIPQALTLMNSPQVAAAINSRRPGSLLEKLLRNTSDDKSVAIELYLRCLSREPTPRELELCVSHVARQSDRAKGFEDLAWALLNSAEFMHRN